MIDAPELLTFLQQEESRATDTELNDERKTALEFYRGDQFGDEVDGRSKLVTRDVAEVVDYMTVSVMRTLVSGDRLVEFEPRRPVMVQAMASTAMQPVEGQQQPQQQMKDISDELAQEAGDRVHWNFLREQDGYSILHDGIKAGLLEKIGVWKSWVERKTRTEQAQLNADELSGLDVVSATPVPEAYDEMGAALHYEIDDLGQPVQIYDAVITVPDEPEFRDAAIPNEQFFYSPDTRTLDKSPYCGDWSRQSIYDLYLMGYPAEELETLYGDEPGEARALKDARDSDRSWTEEDAQRVDWNRVVTLREEYCRWFWEGSVQLVRVHRVGNTILGVIPVKMQPYTLWCPFPMQHRLVGHSLADKVLDIQVVRSHMLRQAMDNLYLSNAPRVWIDEGQIGPTTIDDLLDVAPGAIIRGKSGSTPPKPWDIPFVAGNAFTAMEIMAGEKESRTGITRLNQGLDADTLNKTATGTALMQASGQQIEEYVARNAANGIAELFEKKLALMIAEMPAHEFKIDGEFRNIDPSTWPEDMKLGVRVGLGTGSRDKRLQSVMVLRDAMGSLREMDPRMVTNDNAFNVFKQLVSTLQMGNATQYCVDPSQLGPMPEQPDPNAAAEQAKAQQVQADMMLKREKNTLDAETKREKNIADERLAWEKMDRETQLALLKVMNQRDDTFSPGGSLAQ